MRPARSALVLLLLAVAGGAHAQASDQTTEPDPAKVDLARLIACQGQPEEFMALATAQQDPLKAVALGWRPLPQANMFLSEYELTTPLTVFDHPVHRIAFAGSSVMAVLDLPDPRPLARQLELETAVDTPEKAMFGKELVSEEVRDPATGAALVRSAVLNVSNVTSHPGKTLVGCTYSIEPLEAEPAEAPAGG